MSDFINAERYFDPGSVSVKGGIPYSFTRGGTTLYINNLGLIQGRVKSCHGRDMPGTIASLTFGIEECLRLTNLLFTVQAIYLPESQFSKLDPEYVYLVLNVHIFRSSELGDVDPELAFYYSDDPVEPRILPVNFGWETRAPFDDFEGNWIHAGDRIEHPSGEGGFVRYRGQANDMLDDWVVDYDDGTMSRLYLQIGDRGQAVVRPWHDCYKRLEKKESEYLRQEKKTKD